MKKILLTIISSLLFFSCGNDNKEKLYIYSWADYIPSEIYEDFEKETGIEVIEDIYSSNEEMYTKIKAGGDGYDLIVPSCDYLDIMSKQDMLQKIDKSKLQGLENIDNVVIEKLKKYSNAEDFGVPYMMIPTIIAVNKTEVKDYKKDYSIFEREDLAGRMTLLDDMREVLTAALAVNDYPQDTKDLKAYDKAKDTILKWKKNIVKFDSESFGKGFANKDFVVVQGYPDNIIGELTEEQFKESDFIIPEVGAFASIDSFAILKNAKNTENAYKFIEYILKPEVAAKISEKFKLPSINVKANEISTIDKIYEMKDLEKAQILTDIQDTLDIQNKYWQAILIEN